METMNKNTISNYRKKLTAYQFIVTNLNLLTNDTILYALNYIDVLIFRGKNVSIS